MAEFSVGIVGLDGLGAALTRRLEEQGIGHTATDLNARLLQAHLAGGGSAPVGSPYDLAKVCDLILLAETGDETLRDAVLGPAGLVHALRPGTIIVDMSDASSRSGARARALRERGDLDRGDAGRQSSAGARRQTDAADGGTRRYARTRGCRAARFCDKNSTSRRARHGSARQGAGICVRRLVDRNPYRDADRRKNGRTRSCGHS